MLEAKVKQFAQWLVDCCRQLHGDREAPRTKRVLLLGFNANMVHTVLQYHSKCTGGILGMQLVCDWLNVLLSPASPGVKCLRYMRNKMLSYHRETALQGAL